MAPSTWRLAPGELDRLDGALQLVWYEFYEGLPHVHALGWAETRPGVFHDIYRCLTPLGETAEVVAPCSPDEDWFELGSAFINTLVVLHNRSRGHGRRPPFDALPLLVVGHPHVVDALVSLWRGVAHFRTEDLFRRLRQYDASRTLWLARGDPPPGQPHPLEHQYAAARTPQARRDIHALALVHWWNRSRSLHHRSASLVAIAAAWDQLEARRLATVSRAQVERFLAEWGVGAFGL